MSGTLTPSSGYPMGNRQNGRSLVGRSSMWLRNFIGDGVCVSVERPIWWSAAMNMPAAIPTLSLT